MSTRYAPNSGALKLTGATLVIIAAVMALWIWLASHFWTYVWWGLRDSMFVVLPFVGLLAVLAVLILVGVMANDSDSLSVGLATWALCAVMGLAAVVGFFFWTTSIHNYKVDREYTTAIHQTTAGTPQFNQRAPFSVAAAQVRSNSSIEGADLNDTTTGYIPEHNVFTTLVDGRSALGNYAAVVSQTIPLQGRGTAAQCTFSSNASRSDGGDFSHNLGRLINDKVRWLTYDSADLYGYCDGTTPMVVVPLKAQVGFWVVTERPAGVALYNGRTGDLSIVQDPKALAAIPGPTYPLSLAETQRESTDALGSYGDYLFNRAGFQTTDANGEPDTNSGNSAEFVLGQGKAGVPNYVTPLTDQGSSTAVSHESVMGADQTQPGQLARMTIYAIHPTGVSTTAVESRIRTDYSNIPNWNQLEVQEIAPYGPNEWVATLTIQGGQNILYRIRGTWDLSPFPGQKTAATCLYDGASDTAVQCGSEALQNGNGVGVQLGSGGSPTAPPAAGTPTLNLKGMTPQQLTSLLQQIASALAAQQPGH